MDGQIIRETPIYESVQFLTVLGTIITPIIMAYIAYLTMIAQKRATIVAAKVDDAAVKVAQVAAAATVTAEKVEQVAQTASLDSIVNAETNAVTKATHVMVNSNREEQLASSAEMAALVAEFRPSLANTARAEHAQQLLLEHRARQNQSDLENPQAKFGEMPLKTPLEVEERERERERER